MRRKLVRRVAVAAAGLLLLVVSGFLLTYARWVHGIVDGNRALANGDITAARQTYDTAARRLEQWPSARRLPGYRQLVFNRARALYAAKQDEDLTHMLEAEVVHAPSLADDSEYHFWIGNVEFRKAIAQKDKQAVQAGLEHAAESFRRSLVAAPDDWDAKYDYEVTTRLLEGMRKGKDDNLERIQRGQLKILREDVDKNKEQQQKLAPEKRG